MLFCLILLLTDQLGIAGLFIYLLILFILFIYIIYLNIILFNLIVQRPEGHRRPVRIGRSSAHPSPWLRLALGHVWHISYGILVMAY